MQRRYGGSPDQGEQQMVKFMALTGICWNRRSKLPQNLIWTVKAVPTVMTWESARRLAGGSEIFADL